MAINEEARIPVYLNDEQAKSALKNLQNEADKWRKKMHEAMAGGDMKGMKDAEREMKKASKEASKFRKATFDTNQILNNLSTAKPKELKQAIRELTREQDKYNRGTKEYIAYGKKIRLVRAEMGKVTNELRAQRSLVGRVADGFNKYFGMATAVVASFAGATFTIKSATEAYAKHDDVLSDVMKTTGQTKEEVKELNKELTNIDTRTSRENLNKIAEEGGRIGIAKDEILDFVRVMDIANVALGDSFQGGTEEIANMLGKLKFLYKETKSMDLGKSYLSIASAINELGAEGVASEQNIAEFTTRIGALPSVLKPTIADTFALGAGFEESGIKAEIASRAYSIVLNRAATETDKFAAVMKMSTAEVEAMINTNPVDFFFAFAESLKGMNATETARTLDELKVNANGANKVIGAAANNTDRFRELLLLSNQAFGEANSVIEEFTVKNTNAQAKLEKARKVYADMQLELGERLAPAYASVIHKGSAMLKMLGATVEFLFDNRKALILAAVAIGSYTVAVNAANWATKIYNALTTAATAITKGFNTAVKTSPVGLIISLLTTAATAFYLFGQKADSAKKSQKEFNDEVARGNELLGQSKTLEERASIVKNLSKEQLETLKSDLAMQIREEENFHATLLQKLKKHLEDDSTLKELYERRNQAGLTEIQKININAQIAARQRMLSRELEDENKTNLQRLNNLKAHQARVAAELKTRPKDATEQTGGTPSTFPDLKKSLETAFAQEQNLLKEQFLQKTISQAQYNQALYVLEMAHLTAVRDLHIKNGEDITAIDSQILDKKLAWTKQIDAMLTTSETVSDKLLQEEGNMFDAIDKQMEKHVADYKKAADDKADATIDSERRAFEFEQEINDARQDLKAEYINAVGEVSGALSSMFEEGSAAQIAMLAIEKAAAIAQIIFQTGIANAKAVAASPLTAGQPWVTINTVSAGASIAAIVATTVGQISKSNKNKKTKGMADGGFAGHTGPGGKYEEAQLVQLHKDEYVLPKEGTQNPQIRPIIDIMEIARRNGSLARLDLRQIVQAIPAKQYAQGGFASTPAGSTSYSPPLGGDAAGRGGNTDPELTALIRENIKTMKELQKLKVSLSLETFEREHGKYINIKQTSGL